MLFNSFSYLLFLWTVYVLFWTLRKKRSLRHSMVLVASYWFYGQANWAYTSLLFTSTVIDYFAGLGIERAEQRGDERGRKLWLAASLTTNLGLLGTFKYFNFFVDSFTALLGRMGVEASLFHLDVILPVGISFYTFQTLSYTLDIYRRRMKPTDRFLDFALFVSFFPQLVAGPIVRAIDFLPQLKEEPQLDPRRISSGIFQILRGLTKKLLMADVLGAQMVDRVFANGDLMSEMGAFSLLLVAYAYALQLYGDFAGYSDIAIGSARLLGFELRKNFDAPYKSRSLEEFWGRWHISMSSWFTDYVYIGLGGSRGARWKTYRNTLLAFTAVGLWHGAAWTFVIWGIFHGFTLVVSRLLRGFLPGGKMPAHWIFALLGTLMVVHVHAFAMLLFRCNDMAQFGDVLSQFADWTKPLVAIPWQVGLIMALGWATHMMPDGWMETFEDRFCRTAPFLQGAVVAACIVLFFALRPPGLTPFVYFQF